MLAEVECYNIVEERERVISLPFLESRVDDASRVRLALDGNGEKSLDNIYRWTQRDDDVNKQV